MAEIALRNVEQGLDELEQLERIGLFTKQEVKAVVKRRKHFEYRLRRFVKTRADFVHYINYEIALYQLIQKRREKNHISYKKVEIEHSITNRIDLLFKKAEYKFPGDLSLWFSHIELCRLVRWKSHASELFTRLLQLHPKKPQAWIACAKFQLEDLGETDVGRRTFQRGLRFLSDDKTMWKEYFRMELMFWEKLHKRQEVLELDSESTKDALMEGEIVVIVFCNALEKIPDADLAIDLVRIVKKVDGTEKILNRFNQIVEEKFKDSPSMWIYKATNSSSVTDCFAVFEEGIKKCSDTQTLWDEYIKFCLKRAERTQQPKYIQKALDLMKRLGGDALSRDLVLEQVRLTKDVQLAERAVARFPNDVEACALYLFLLSQSGKDIWPIFEKLELTAGGQNRDTSLLWQILFDFYKEHDSEQLRKILEKGILKSGDTGIFIKSIYVDLMLSENVESNCQLFKKITSLRPLSLAIYEKFLETFGENKPMVRNVFEEAARELGSDHEDLWLSYLKWEQQSGRPETSGLLYQRALDCLQNEHVQNFVVMYTLEMELQ